MARLVLVEKPIADVGTEHDQPFVGSGQLEDLIGESVSHVTCNSRRAWSTSVAFGER